MAARDGEARSLLGPLGLAAAQGLADFDAQVKLGKVTCTKAESIFFGAPTKRTNSARTFHHCLKYPFMQKRSPILKRDGAFGSRAERHVEPGH